MPPANNEPITTLSKRTDELESRLAFQEDLLNTLNDVIAQQDMRMAAFTRKLETLEQQLKLQGGFAGGDDSHEPPPHY